MKELGQDCETLAVKISFSLKYFIRQNNITQVFLVQIVMCSFTKEKTSVYTFIVCTGGKYEFDHKKIFSTCTLMKIEDKESHLMSWKEGGHVLLSCF